MHSIHDLRRIDLNLLVILDALLEERILANSIIGDVAECRDRVQVLAEALGPHHLILKPASCDPEANRRALTLFAEKVRPQFMS